MIVKKDKKKKRGLLSSMGNKLGLEEGTDEESPSRLSMLAYNSPLGTQFPHLAEVSAANKKLQEEAPHISKVGRANKKGI